jgi:hypothetical protein
MPLTQHPSYTCRQPLSKGMAAINSRQVEQATRQHVACCWHMASQGTSSEGAKTGSSSQHKNQVRLD